jgi:hypothetical protein
MENKIKDLYEDFKNGGLSRRDFLGKLTAVTGSLAAAMAIIPISAISFLLMN